MGDQVNVVVAGVVGAIALGMNIYTLLREEENNTQHAPQERSKTEWHNARPLTHVQVTWDVNV